MKKFLWLIPALAFLGCGKELDLSQFSDVPRNISISDTVYVKEGDDWRGAGGRNFNQPEDIYIGHDGFVYIADTGNDRIVMLDLAGNYIGEKFITHPVAIAQDRRFNLIVAGELIKGIYRFGAIYKIRLFEAGHNINIARVDTIYLEKEKPQRRFTGVAELIDNSYYVCRVGPDNQSLFDPDNMILHFSKNDSLYSTEYIDLTPNLEPTGSGIRSINQMSAIATFSDRRRATDFIVAQTDPGASFKVKWFRFNPGSEVTPPNWEAYFKPNATDMTTQNFFVSPEDITLDTRNNIYVIDAGLDSLMKFDVRGKLLKESFGPGKLGDDKLTNPKGVAWFDRILYIADTGNNRIVRFKLSTDIR
jgi:DNA-binding beta-propeller fold protein YncE